MDTYSLCLNSDHFAEGYSVTRLGVFESYWCQNFLEQVASIFGNILGYLEKYNFKVKNAEATFDLFWATIYSTFWSHWKASTIEWCLRGWN